MMVDDISARATIRERARAKINLYLHVTGKRQDGYHLLESLTVFPDIGDMLLAEPAKGLSLSIDGPFAGDLAANEDNLILRAALALQAREGISEGAALHLTKSLPISSGIGGGSADAAATLRALNQLWKLDLAEDQLAEIGLPLGADIPVCVGSRCRVFRGIGDQLSEGPELPPLYILLANPLRGVETKSVFHARSGDPISAPSIIPARFDTADAFSDWLRNHTQNDLAHAAQSILPEITEVKAVLSQLQGALIARMSGSGATCFALFADEQSLEAAAADARLAQPTWWIETASLSAQTVQRSRSIT